MKKPSDSALANADCKSAILFGSTIIILSRFLKVAKLLMYFFLQESEIVAGRWVLPWKACFKAIFLIGFPSCLPPGPVITFALTSAILIPIVTDSDPLFIQTNFENGHSSREYPTSLRNASANLF